MRLPSAVVLSAVACAGCHDPTTEPTPSEPASLVEARVVPFCVRPSESYRIEIALDGGDVAAIRLPLPALKPLPGEIEDLVLLDDGSQGDAVADDHVFSVEIELGPQPDIMGRYIVRELDLDLEYDDGGIETVTEDLALTFHYVLDPVSTPPAVEIAEGVSQTSHLVVMELPLEGTYPAHEVRSRTVARTYYESFADDRDFLIIANAFSASHQPAGRYLPVRNDAEGLGIREFDRSAEFGSAGRLQGIVNTYFGNINPALINHELLHRWAGSGLRPLDLWGAVDQPGVHWGAIVRPSSGFVGAEGVMGVFRMLQPVEDWYVGWQGPDGLGREFNDLELYLMGLAPLDEVEDPILTLVDPSFEAYVLVGPTRFTVFNANGVRSVSTDEMQSTLGPRTPAVSEAQTEFRAAVIVVSDRPLNPDELAYYDFGARELEQEQSTAFGPTFAAATLGRARLSTVMTPE